MYHTLGSGPPTVLSEISDVLDFNTALSLLLSDYYKRSINVNFYINLRAIHFIFGRVLEFIIGYLVAFFEYGCNLRFGDVFSVDDSVIGVQ